MMRSRVNPMIPSYAPVIPASVRYAVPPGRIVSSAVCTCVCVPTTAETRPSRYQPMACFSDVASPCMSTRMTLTSPARASSSSATRKGESAWAGMKT